MKGRVVAIETGPRFRRAALLVDGTLEALEIDRLGETLPLPGAIYRARVTETIPALGAAFADLGNGTCGFLPEAAALAPGTFLLAQVRREPEADKAARLSPDLQYRGRHVVFTPTRPGINVSRRIADASERARLADALAPFAERGGFVLRTGAAGTGTETIREEASTLADRHAALSATGDPGLLLPAPVATERIASHLDPSTTLVTDPASADALQDRNPAVETAPFDRLDLDARIADLLLPRADLPEGWLSIDPTPALVAIDVNTGGGKGGDAAQRVNLAAAAAIPRLLALRRLGGVVMIDFAGAPKGEARPRIAKALTRAARDRLDRPALHGWGPAGLFEMVCPRPGRSLAALLKDTP